MGSNYRQWCIGVLLALSAGQALAGDDNKRVKYEKRWYSEAQVREILGPRDGGYRDVFAPWLHYVYAPDVPVAPGPRYRYSGVRAQGRGSDVFVQRRNTKLRYSQVADAKCMGAIVEALKRVRSDALRQSEVKRKHGRNLILVGIQSNEYRAAPLNIDMTGNYEIDARSRTDTDTRILCNVYKTVRSDTTYSFSTVLTASGTYIESR